MNITKEWLEGRDDLFLTELAATILRIKAQREQVSERKMLKGAKVYV